MYFQNYELNPKGNGYEVILYIKPHHSLEEFAEEFGISKRTEKEINQLAIGYVKKRFPNLKVKTIKVIVGGALVSTIMFGGNMTQAFAHEHETTTQTELTTETTTGETTSETNLNVETEEGTTGVEEEPAAEEKNTTDETTNTSPKEEESTIDEASEDVPMDEPGLIPSDFFYFVEIVTEKIQLALTFGDTAKAELMSKFSNERIAEANALFETGDTEGAIDLLNKALESQELALDYVTEEEENEPTSPEEDPAVPEGELPPKETEETAPTEEGDAVPEEEAGSDMREELQNQFNQNITALLLAMEKVENPKAKAALAKNVEKAFAKMEKKLGKVKNIEDRIAQAVPTHEAVEDLRRDIESDQEEFESDIKDVGENATSVGIITPNMPKHHSQEKAQNNLEKERIEQKNPQTKAQKGLEKAQEKEEKGQVRQEQGKEKAREKQSQSNQSGEKAPIAQEKASEGKQTGQPKATFTNETGEVKKNEKRANIPAPKKETEEEHTNRGPGSGIDNKKRVETEVKADIVKGNEKAKRNQGKGNQDNDHQEKGNEKNNK